MAIEHITDHSDRAVALLLAQYQGKPLMEGFVRAFLDEVQEYEDELWTLVGLLDIDRATGIDLDRIGRIVRQPRSSESDEVYRRLLRARLRPAPVRSWGGAGTFFVAKGLHLPVLVHLGPPVVVIRLPVFLWGRFPCAVPTVACFRPAARTLLMSGWLRRLAG